MHVIDLVPGDPYRRDHFGIILQSKMVHRVTGKGVYNPHHHHRLDVWINANWHDPRGNPTDADLYYYLAAQAMVISSRRDPNAPEVGPDLTIDDVVVLRIGSREIGKFKIVAGHLSDPHLERISQS